MRVLFWFLLLACAAVAVALAARLTTGYALFVAPPYRVELSLNLLLLLVVGGFIAGYVLLRIVRRGLGLPEEVRLYRQRQHLERARAKQDAALVALLEGRYGRARQFAEEALAIPHSSGLSALLGARAAIATREFAAAEALLSRADASVPSLAVPRLMLEAEMKLEQGQPLEALAILGMLRKEAGSHTAALRLELRAQQGAGRYAEIPPLVDQLVKRKVYGVREGEFVRAAAHAQELAARVLDGEGLRTYWSKLTETEQRNPKIARAAARSFIALGGDREAAELLARSLEREWDSELVALYAECRPADGAPQLEQAERWLAKHPDDATLLYALGVLCERAQLWGKAQTYFEASLAVENSWRTRVALGELFARLNRDFDANAQLAAALKLALAELDRG
ncbi:MAG TPA: heme biosynthesis HemY N-terminal domain-containing protein [Rhodanobacteraceae bacterium]|nr:heme biosynthesis HemY N-terminal domain-containing protein [Rhodanobacteraceae bacterium]